MPKKRTKQQKIHAKLHYSIPSNGSFTVNGKSSEASTVKATSFESLYQYDPIYLRRDLTRTAVISVFILALQLGIYFLLK